MKVKILSDFHVPNMPAFVAGEVVEMENAMAETMSLRGLVEKTEARKQAEPKQPAKPEIDEKSTHSKK